MSYYHCFTKVTIINNNYSKVYYSLKGAVHLKINIILSCFRPHDSSTLFEFLSSAEQIYAWMYAWNTFWVNNPSKQHSKHFTLFTMSIFKWSFLINFLTWIVFIRSDISSIIILLWAPKTQDQMKRLTHIMSKTIIILNINWAKEEQFSTRTTSIESTTHS